jgi:phosphoribosyl 1,2-cyclic phosphate phosphodiesterase
MGNSALFIGSGSSLGVPVIGCHCAICTSQDPKNNRTRSSLILDWEGKRFLIDSGPDLRLQALKNGISHLDGVILTHAHHDHTAGLDDLRLMPIKNKQDLPCLMSKETAEEIRFRFHYLLKSKEAHKIQLELLPHDKGMATFAGISFRYFTYMQQEMKVQGFRFGSFAYVTDIKTYTDQIFEELKGVETLVLSALRFTPSPMHFSVDDAIDFIGKVSPTRAYLTHIAHELDHEKTNAYLPPNIQLAFDGLKIPL